MKVTKHRKIWRTPPSSKKFIQKYGYGTYIKATVSLSRHIKNIFLFVKMRGIFFSIKTKTKTKNYETKIIPVCRNLASKRSSIKRRTKIKNSSTIRYIISK